MGDFELLRYKIVKARSSVSQELDIAAESRAMQNSGKAPLIFRLLAVLCFGFDGLTTTASALMDLAQQN